MGKCVCACICDKVESSTTHFLFKIIYKNFLHLIRYFSGFLSSKIVSSFHFVCIFLIRSFFYDDDRWLIAVGIFISHRNENRQMCMKSL